MNLKTKFIIWYYNEFQITNLYYDMEKIVENSPYHRERNVATHTDMVVAQYLSLSHDEWNFNDLCGAFASAFHDVGKPQTLEVKYKEEYGGEYNTFNSHEIISARMWEDWATCNWTLLMKEFNMIPDYIFYIGWMIEYHLPWKITDTEKLNRLIFTAIEIGQQKYVDFLTADYSGRISDYKNTFKNNEKWCEDFLLACENKEYEINDSLYEVNSSSKKLLILPIAPSGAGKTTLYKNISLAHDNLYLYSWDNFRTEWYVDKESVLNNKSAEIYRMGFENHIKDPEFINKSRSIFMDLIKKGHNIYVDNTNIKKKTRRFFIDEGRKHGYNVICYLIPISFETLKERHLNRIDKTVPEDVVYRQYYSLQLPSYHEFDQIFMYNNL